MQKTILKVSDVHGKLSYARDSRQTLAYMICHAQQAYVLQRGSVYGIQTFEWKIASFWKIQVTV